MNSTVLYVATVLIWGTTWIGIELQLGSVAPEVSIFWRYAGASLLLFGWCRLRRKRLSFPLAAHARFIQLGVLMFSTNYLLTYHAQENITSALAAIAFSTMLWLNIINARLFFGIRSGPRVMLGSVIGVAGIVVLFYPQVKHLSWSDATFYGAALAVFGAIVTSLGNMASQSAQARGLPVVQSNAWGMAYGTVLIGLIALASGKTFAIEWTLRYVGSLLYLTVFGSILAFGAYLTLLGRIGAHRAGYAMVMFPVVALTISVLFEDLVITGNLIVGVCLVLLGNIFVLETRRRPNLPEADPLAAAAPAD